MKRMKKSPGLHTVLPYRLIQDFSRGENHYPRLLNRSGCTSQDGPDDPDGLCGRICPICACFPVENEQGLAVNLKHVMVDQLEGTGNESRSRVRISVLTENRTTSPGWDAVQGPPLD